MRNRHSNFIWSTLIVGAALFFAISSASAQTCSFASAQKRVDRVGSATDETKGIYNQIRDSRNIDVLDLDCERLGYTLIDRVSESRQGVGSSETNNALAKDIPIAFVHPHKVKTVSVRADGSIGSSKQARDPPTFYPYDLLNQKDDMD